MQLVLGTHYTCCTKEAPAFQLCEWKRFFRLPLATLRLIRYETPIEKCLTYKSSYFIAKLIKAKEHNGMKWNDSSCGSTPEYKPNDTWFEPYFWSQPFQIAFFLENCLIFSS